MHTTGSAHLTNYELYRSSLFKFVYADTQAKEKKGRFVSYITGVVNDICCKATSVGNTLKLNHWSFLKATVYMLYNNSCTEIYGNFKMYI
jgi:hypothetical protein